MRSVSETLSPWVRHGRDAPVWLQPQKLQCTAADLHKAKPDLSRPIWENQIQPRNSLYFPPSQPDSNDIASVLSQKGLGQDWVRQVSLVQAATWGAHHTWKQKKILIFFTVSRLVLPERHLTVSSVVKSVDRAGQPSFLPHHYFLACWFSMGRIVGNIQILYTLIAFAIDFYGSVSS